MAETVADFMLSRLSEWGVTRLYGYPGDGINGIDSSGFAPARPMHPAAEAMLV